MKICSVKMSIDLLREALHLPQSTNIVSAKWEADSQMLRLVLTDHNMPDWLSDHGEIPQIEPTIHVVNLEDGTPFYTWHWTADEAQVYWETLQSDRPTQRGVPVDPGDWRWGNTEDPYVGQANASDHAPPPGARAIDADDRARITREELREGIRQLRGVDVGQAVDHMPLTVHEMRRAQNALVDPGNITVPYHPEAYPPYMDDERVLHSSMLGTPEPGVHYYRDRDGNGVLWEEV